MELKENNTNQLLPVGTLLQMGKYRVEAHLASGGFGNTYVVTNLQFDERLALKEFFMKGINERLDSGTISVSNSANHRQFDAQREKFKKEARRLRMLQKEHPNRHLVKVDDLFDENATTYYVMEYIDGESLSKRLKRTRQPMTEAEVRQVLDQLLDALSVVHSQQIWHLDLKPGNILVDKSGRVVLIDFGASKQMSASESFTTTTSMCYTPGYAPTEQISQNLNRIGPWTDFYALGATLYNLLTNQAPPSVDDVQEGFVFTYKQKVSPAMQRLIRWCMTPNRLQRPQSISEIQAFLENPDDEVKDPETILGNDSHDEDTQFGQSSKSSSKPTEKTSKKKSATPKPQPATEQPSTFATLRSKPWFLPAAITAGVIILGTCIGYLAGGHSSSPTHNDSLAYFNGVTIGDTTKVNYVENMRYASALGVCTYTGYVDESNVPNGKGTARFDDGSVYEGPFVHGTMVGTNVHYVLGNGDTFEGSFVENAFSKGRYTFKSDGAYFEGTFKNGEPADGTWYDKDGRKTE